MRVPATADPRFEADGVARRLSAGRKAELAAYVVDDRGPFPST